MSAKVERRAGGDALRREEDGGERKKGRGKDTEMQIREERIRGETLRIKKGKRKGKRRGGQEKRRAMKGEE